jgi:hypothetical protein
MTLPTNSSASHLCSTCSSIFTRADAIEEEIHSRWGGGIRIPVGNPHYVHHQNLTDFKISVAGKCYICVRLWEECNLEADTTARPVDIRYSLTAKDPQDLSRMIVWFMEGELDMVLPRLRGSYVVMPTKGKICPNSHGEERLQANLLYRISD